MALFAAHAAGATMPPASASLLSPEMEAAKAPADGEKIEKKKKKEKKEKEKKPEKKRSTTPPKQSQPQQGPKPPTSSTHFAMPSSMTAPKASDLPIFSFGAPAAAPNNGKKQSKEKKQPHPHAYVDPMLDATAALKNMLKLG